MTAQSESPSLVPEVLISDLSSSLRFWCGLCEYTVRYDQPEEGFAYIQCGSAHLMLEQIGVVRKWIAGPLERPLGRGINFQINVPELDTILSILIVAAYPLFMEPETKWYRVGEGEEAGVRQFVVADPDGYLVRFQTSIGRRELLNSDSH